MQPAADMQEGDTAALGFDRAAARSAPHVLHVPARPSGCIHGRLHREPIVANDRLVPFGGIGPLDSLESLIEASAAGNQSAFGALYDAAAPQLFGLALRILKRRDWAEDVLQEALVSAWRNAGDYRRELGSGKAW